MLPIPKKDGKTVSMNYGGTSLIDVAEKIRCLLLLLGFGAAQNRQTGRNQKGFERGRGYLDQIVVTHVK